MKDGVVLTVAFPPRYQGTPATMVLVGQPRLLVELPNGSQTWIRDPDVNWGSRRTQAA